MFLAFLLSVIATCFIAFITEIDVNYENDVIFISLTFLIIFVVLSIKIYDEDSN